MIKIVIYLQENNFRDYAISLQGNKFLLVRNKFLVKVTRYLGKTCWSDQRPANLLWWHSDSKLCSPATHHVSEFDSRQSSDNFSQVYPPFHHITYALALAYVHRYHLKKLTKSLWEISLV